MIIRAMSMSAACVLSCAAAFSAGLADDVWFAADFDRPAVVGGVMIETEYPAGAIVEGRYGKACFFRRMARNVLLPTSDFLTATNSFAPIAGSKPVPDVKAGTLAFSGGEMRFLPQSTGQPHTWSTKVVSTTFAMEVKGPAGGELVLTPEVTELTDKHVKSLQRSDKKFSLTNCISNVATSRTFRLTGKWQRVWNVATYDIRTRWVRRVGWRVKTSGPVTMRKFLQQPTGMSHYSDVLQPTEWVEGGSVRAEYPLQVSGKELLSGFPASNGTFSCWLKTPDGWIHPKRHLRAFIYQAGWEHMWGFTGRGFSTSSGWGKSAHGLGAAVIGRTNEWTHFAATWNADEFVAYVNGRRIVRNEKPNLLEMSARGGTMRIGGDGMGGSADAVMDDVVIFKRALTSDEVARLAKAATGVIGGGDTYLSSPPVMTAFPRNQSVAAIRLPVDAPRDETLSLEAEIGAVKMPVRKTKLVKGPNDVECTFRPADWHTGKYAWKIRLVRADGAAVVCREGTLTIVPGVERGGFRVMSASAPGKKELEFLQKLGFNAVSLNRIVAKDVNRCKEHGFRYDLRLENPWMWRSTNFDFAKIRADAVKRLKPYAGDPMWDSTLVNSEVYGAGSAETAVKYAAWREIAKKELGHDPVVAFTTSPCGINWGKVGLEMPRGVLKRSDVYDTLAWFMRRGMPQLMMTRIGAEVARELSPGITVWSEPSPSLENLDMSADWIYSRDPWQCLGFLRYYEATPRGQGKLFYPYLSMGYWSPDFPEGSCRHPTQKDPKTGKPVTVWALQTSDELQIKSMMCIGGAAVDSLAFFSVDWCWGQGITNGVLHEKGLPLVFCKGWSKYCIAEKDAAEKFGAFMRRDFIPAAKLLRNIPNLRSPVALLLPREIGYSGEFWWPRVTYVRQLMKLFSEMPIPFDVLFDEEFNVETLSKYRYVFYPQLNCITPEHDRVMRAMPSTTTFLHDDNTHRAGKVLNYPNFEHVKGLSMHFPAEKKNLEIPMTRWMGPKVDALRGRLAAWSEEDGTNAWTFVKDYKGVRYVTVVNNARRAGGCPQTDILTNATYRPMGAPLRITTNFADLGSRKVYRFNPADGDHEVEVENGRVTLDYPAAASSVFCIYPAELSAPELDIEGDPRVGGEAKLVVRIADEDGKPAPGRQVVRLVLTDPDGRVCDESGLYTVEDGKTEITMRFARSENSGSLFSRWKAHVTDLTTGETATRRFSLSE